MLSFAAISPHPPIIIPTIGRDNLDRVKKTIKAMETLANQMAKVNPDTIIVISPHGPIFSDAFSLNLAEKYSGNFQMFGDLTTRMEFKGDLGLAYRIRKRMEVGSPRVPLTMVSEPDLDHGTTVPLYYLTQKIKNFSIIPIGYSALDWQTHLGFGQKLKEEIVQTNKKVAIIASGDLSHRLTPEAPAGYSQQGEKFDKELVKLIKAQQTNEILNLDPKLVEEAGECGLRSIIILLGVLKNLNYRVKILSYEGPFGVGYLVANFQISN